MSAVRNITLPGMAVVLALVLASFGRPAVAMERRHASLVDINRASAEELKTLPGIADAYAASIARNRPYRNKAQLLSRKVIPEAVYGRIKSRIVARQ
jgi:competence protein ComEA